MSLPRRRNSGHQPLPIPGREIRPAPLGVFPLLAESIYVVALNIPRGDNDMSMLLGCSPLGTWIMTLADVSGPVAPGLVVQGLICAGCLAFAARAKK